MKEEEAEQRKTHLATTELHFIAKEMGRKQKSGKYAKGEHPKANLKVELWFPARTKSYTKETKSALNPTLARTHTHTHTIVTYIANGP